MTYATHVVDLLCCVQPCRQHAVCHQSQSASVVFSLGLSTIPHVIMYVSTTCFLAHADTFCTPHVVRGFRILTAPATVSSGNFLFPASDSTILAVGSTRLHWFLVTVSLDDVAALWLKCLDLPQSRLGGVNAFCIPASSAPVKLEPPV